MYLTQIITRNIQSHKEVVIDLPPSGFVIFTGNNSNGKSVIIRATRAIILGQISKPQKRADLLDRKSTSGEITYIRNDGTRLSVVIAREAARTYVSLMYPGQEAIVRYVSDKAWRDLIRKFGWNVVPDYDVTLNVAEEDDALLFYKTSQKLNGAVLDSVKSDPIAEAALENLTQLSKDARTCRDAAMSGKRATQQALLELKDYDIPALEEQKKRLEYYYSFLSRLYIPTLPELKAVPKIHFYNVYDPQLPDIKPVPRVKFHGIHAPRIPEIRYPRIHNISCNIPDITGIAQEIATIKNNKCPTCGRGLVDASTLVIRD